MTRRARKSVKIAKPNMTSRTSTKEFRGKKEVVMEATRVEKKTLDASLFVPPPDYTEMKMPGLGR